MFAYKTFCWLDPSGSGTFVLYVGPCYLLPRCEFKVTTTCIIEWLTSHAMSPCSDFLPLQGRSQDFFRGTHMQLTKYPFNLMVVHGKEMYQKSVLQMQNLLFNFLNLLLFRRCSCCYRRHPVLSMCVRTVGNPNRFQVWTRTTVTVAPRRTV